MARSKAVYFRDEEGFVLTFPADDPLYDPVSAMTSADIRRAAGFESFRDLQTAADGGNVRAFLRTRLREALAREIHPGQEPPNAPHREHAWPERDHAVAARAQATLARFAPNARRVLDPFAGTGRYPVTSAQQGAESFWCEISPVYRFLATTRIRALFRSGNDRELLAARLNDLAVALPDSMQRSAGSLPAGTAAASRRCLLDHDDRLTTSTLEHDLLRAAAVSLIIDDEEPTADAIARQLVRLGRSLLAERELPRFPTQLADDAADLAGMRSIEADVLLTSPPHLSAIDYFPTAAEELLGIDSRRERARAIAATAKSQQIRRGRATVLQREAAMGQLHDLPKLLSGDTTATSAREVVATLVTVVSRIEEPGKAAIAASYFTGMARALAAVEHHLTSEAIAIIDVQDSWFGGMLIHNDQHLADLLSLFGFERVANETLTSHALPMRDDEPEGERHRNHRLLVMQRRRSSRQSREKSWAAWA